MRGFIEEQDGVLVFLPSGTKAHGSAMVVLGSGGAVFHRICPPTGPVIEKEVLFSL